MNQEEKQKEEWNKIYDEYEKVERKYKEYTNRFFTKTINGEITKKAKEFWDFACSMVLPK